MKTKQEKELEELAAKLEETEFKVEFLRKIDDVYRHIKNVQEACLILGKRLIEQGEYDFGKHLIANSLGHDKSKFFGVEWDYLNTETTEKDKKLFLVALDQHQRTNQHHEAHWGSIDNMPRIYQAEMVCDWFSRSAEMGTDLREYFSKVAVDKYKIRRNSIAYKNIKYFIETLLDKKFKPVVEKKKEY